MVSYVPLWVKSNFSFLEGASHPSELVEQAEMLGLGGIALTDRDGVYGVVQAHMRALEVGFPLLIGAEITVGSIARDDAPTRRLVLLCEDREGYAHLCRLITVGRQRSPKGRSIVSFEEVRDAAKGLVALALDGDTVGALAEAYEHSLYALCVRHRFEDEPNEEALRLVAARCAVPVVAGNEVLYHGQNRQPLHDVLSCIRHGVTLADAGRYIRPNAEFALKTPHAMGELFADDPIALTRTLEVAERCRFSLSQLRYRYPIEDRPQGKGERDWLYELTLEGANQRYGEEVPGDVLAQIDRELDLIVELDYGGYFLTMWEIVQFCRRENILCQGRGSAANSAVCYCLGITAIDPVRMDLLFERFISRERAEPPDIDLDIEHNRREEVIQWVYQRYGRRRAAMVANVIRYRTRSAIRDVGRVLGVAETALDRLSKLLGSRFAELGSEALNHAGLDPTAPVHQHLLRLADEILDFPRHLSIHPGGFVLGHQPVDSIVPIEPATMDGRTVIQWDKYAVEDLGLFKVDLLGLGALTQVHECLDLLRLHDDLDLEMADIPADDPATYKMITEADTVGVFQIESRAQMSMLPRLRPQTFYDLVVEVAIVRPGPIQGNMVHPYLKRRRGEQAEQYPHPSLERVLKKTLGVPIFQEQVMKIAVLVGGYSAGEADQLRRDMAAWKSSGRIDRHRQRLISRMIDNGITPDFAESIFSQIQGFGEYGFPESHAASFALIAYITAWLRCHHPAAFTCSLLNAQPMGFYSPATIVEDAKRRGIEVHPIDVEHSDWHCTLEPACSAETDRWAVRMGLRYVKGLGVRERQALTAESRPYLDLERFVRRTRLSHRALLALAECGAFDGIGLSRRDAIWDIEALLSKQDDSLRLSESKETGLGPLFESLSSSQSIAWDYRTSHHSTRGHPMQILRDELDRRDIPDAGTVNMLPDGTRTRYVGLAITRQQPGTASGVTFYTLEDETGFVNLVVWKAVFEKYSVLARTAVLLGVSGKVQSDSDVVHLIADHLWEPDLDFSKEGTSTRSFH